ncbi:MAG: class I SAM-dependent methyltransferase [Desulfobacterium sp.]|nr:class I SAM-dependent methyltransferase [Desulfobacterium sp.]
MTENAIWEKSPCPLCQGNKALPLFRFDPGVSTVKMPGNLTGEGIGLVRCMNCSLVYLEDRPTRDSMERLYASDQYFGCDAETGYSDYEIQERSLGDTFRLFLKNLCQRNMASGTMADIGCGNGYLLKEARPYFSFRVGSDMSDAAVEQASLVCDKAVCGGPEEILKAGLSGFDLVTAVSVLEHLYDPVAFMRQCSNLVRPGGNIVLSVPHFASPWRKLMGRFWTSFKIPEHLAYYEKKSLGMLGERSGLELVEFIPYHHYFPVSVVLDKLGICPRAVMKSPVGRRSILLPSVMLTAVYKR